MTSQLEMQLGKKGLTDEFLEEIKKRFEKPGIKNIKISVLKSARDSKLDVKVYAEKIKEFLGDNYSYRVLGFSIFLKKWRKSRVLE